MAQTPNFNWHVLDGSVSGDDAEDFPSQYNPVLADLDSILSRLRSPRRCKLVKTNSQQINNQVDPPNKISFQDAAINVGGMANLAQNLINITSQGDYLIMASMRWSSGVSGTSRKSILKINGSVADVSTVLDGASYSGAAQNKNHLITTLSIGDQVWLEPYQTNGSPLDVVGDFGDTWLSVVELSFGGVG